jgi:glucose/arabinose dehydrogenase
MAAVRGIAGVAALAVVLSGCGGDDEPTGAASPTTDPAPDQTEAPAETIRVAAELVAGGLDLPNDLADLGDGRMLVSNQRGDISVLDGGDIQPDPFLDLSDRVIAPDSSGGQELGLSGFAVHPDFSSTGTVYVMFTEPGDAGRGRVDVLAEFTAPDPSGGPADPATERELLRIDQEGSTHVGGHMAFGADGLLYVGLGDAGDSDLAQDPSSLQGTIIRIDVDGDPYAVPGDNPFADGGGAPEVYSYGFRNPFRVSWDDELGLLVAEPMWRSKDQEAHVAVSGANFGYPLVPDGLAGPSCYADESATEPHDDCLTGPDGQEYVAPVIEFAGQITSGVVRYTGSAIPELAGKVIVADWTGPMIAAEPVPGAPRWLSTPIDVEPADDAPWMSGSYLWALDKDSAGEVYVLSIPRSFGEGEGALYRLVPAQ